MVEKHELTVGAESRGRDERFAKEDAGVGNEVAGLGRVGAVEYESVRAESFERS